jgi:hypothetical protein
VSEPLFYKDAAQAPKAPLPTLFSTCSMDLKMKYFKTRS